MSRLSTGIENRLELAEVAISNTLVDTELYAVLSAHGYDTAQLQEGKRLCENARGYTQHQQGEYGELRAARAALKRTRQQINASYMYHVEIARVALRHDCSARQKLGLTEERKQRLAGWLEQARLFYCNALSDPAILHALAEFGLTQEMLEEGRRQLDRVSGDNAMRSRRKGSARGATIGRNEALAALDAWMRDFTRIAHIVFKGRPQLLDKLGIRPHARNRPATPPAATLTPATGLLRDQIEGHADREPGDAGRDGNVGRGEAFALV